MEGSEFVPGFRRVHSYSHSYPFYILLRSQQPEPATLLRELQLRRELQDHELKQLD